MQWRNLRFLLFFSRKQTCLSGVAWEDPLLCNPILEALHLRQPSVSHDQTYPSPFASENRPPLRKPQSLICIASSMPTNEAQVAHNLLQSRNSPVMPGKPAEFYTYLFQVQVGFEGLDGGRRVVPFLCSGLKNNALDSDDPPATANL